MPMKKEINVLLFGTSGNGKSTFINALNKIVRYRTLDEAEGDVSQVAIAVQCRHNGFQIRQGYDTNERLEQGGSSTVKPKIYIFPAKKVTLRIIDTPGMGDTAGSQEDQVHIAHILSCIASREFKQIHGILFFFKNDENRLTPFLKFQLCELFSCLGKAAVNNIKFVMTHAGELCELGQAEIVVEKFMETMELDIPCTEENTFCVENKHFLYLVGRNDPKNRYTEKQTDHYRRVYENTANEYSRLLQNLYRCETPYDVSNMTALKRAVQLWPVLSPLLKVVDEKENEIKEAIDSHDLTLEKLIWQITGDTARLVKHEVKKFKEKVKKEKVRIEEEEIDVQVPTIEWKNVTEKVLVQRIEREERQRDVTRYRMEYETIEKDKTRQVFDLVTKEKQVERWRPAGSGSSSSGSNVGGILATTAAGAAAGSVIPVVGTVLGAAGGFLGGLLGFGRSKSPPRERWEKYYENETYEVPVISEKTRKVQKRIPTIKTDAVKETYYEPVIKDEFREVTKKVPEIGHRTEKKKEKVPKVEEVFEEEEKDRVEVVTDPVVQNRLNEAEAKKKAEEEERAKLCVKYAEFDAEKEQLRDVTERFARCLHENTIVALNSAKSQYLKEELIFNQKGLGSASAVEWLKEKLADAETIRAIFKEANQTANNKDASISPDELLEKVKQLCELKNFGPCVRQAVLECEKYDYAEFETVVLKDAAEGYMFDEMVTTG